MTTGATGRSIFLGATNESVVTLMQTKANQDRSGTSASSESAFNTDDRTLDQFRSSLLPTTAKGLICCQDWLRQAFRSISIKETIEELESWESEIRNDPEVLENIIPRTEMDCKMFCDI